MNPLNGFTGAVDLTCAVAPVVSNGPVCTISPASVTLDGINTALATADIATVKGKIKTPPGTFTLTFTGTGNTVSHFATATFVVK